MGITPKACSFLSALVLTPTPQDYLPIWPLPQALFSGAGATAGALGPVSGPVRRCPLAPAMGILSTDGQTLVLLCWHNSRASLCWPKTEETQVKTETSRGGRNQST